MIDYLHLKNFRAFKDQKFFFKKLNVFIGKNNSGKSSAISALNVLAQTIHDQDFDGSPLVLNGPFDQLGTYIDVVHGNLSRRKMEIEVGFDEWSLSTEFKYRGQRREIEITKLDLKEKGLPIYRYALRKDAYDIFIKSEPYEKLFPKARKRRPKFRGMLPYNPMLFEMHLRAGNAEEQAIERFREVTRSLGRARRSLHEYFEQFDSISPFRDRPQRTYLYSGETARRVGITGSNTATMLAADASRRGGMRRDLVKSVSEWFQYTGIAKSLIVESLTPRHFELCLTSNDGTKHNLCDVGFGCSQVLPVLVSGLSLFGAATPSRGRRLLVVQEPEIHLHPDAQAAMGSFFASLVGNEGQIFIETHSDNLVLRIARHVALGDLAPSDVAIFYVADDETSRTVTELSISETGAFTPDWPNGFFPQRQAESLELARAAMKRRQGEVKQRELEFKYPEVG